VVYFTDGLMNTIQDKFHCGGTSNNTLTLLNYGGFDSGSDVDSSTLLVQQMYLTVITLAGSGGFKYDAKGDICTNASGGTVTQFVSQQYGNKNFSPCQRHRRSPVQGHSNCHCHAYRESGPDIYLYHRVGRQRDHIDAGFSGTACKRPLLFNIYSGQPAGEFFYIPDCPSSQCTTEVDTVFETIAAKVLLRLTE